MSCGLVNLLKPPGMTSSDAVCELRRIFNQKRVGHTGTLDPGAAGVLPICVGRATRLFDYLVDKEKEYIAEVTFGAATDTQDSYGKVLERMETAVTSQALEAALPAFLGEQEQLAPMFSALSSGGKKLYELARAGAEPVEKRRRVCIHALELLQRTGPQSFLLRVECGRGTYVRTLCQDIGKTLGVPAHLSFLLRSRSGSFSLAQAYTLDELGALREAGALAQAVIPPDEALAGLPQMRISLSEEERRLFLNGAAVAPKGWEDFPREVPLRAYVEGRFQGLAKSAADGLRMILFLEEENGNDA
ncbi:MAG: tRNA pseudouridine(55) synthase TruB [Clostridia bacterium]|nr:tRNA pseudouridine(55) synthase TruB [Clostridia bacterium]